MLATFALATELIQLKIPNREFSFVDIASNLTGISCAYFTVRTYRYFNPIIQQKTPDKLNSSMNVNHLPNESPAEDSHK